MRLHSANVNAEMRLNFQLLRPGIKGFCFGGWGYDLSAALAFYNVWKEY